MKIYTKTGDDGETGLFGGGRVPKNHPRVEAYGSVDELNAQMGWAVTAVTNRTIAQRLQGLQSDMFVIGSILATPEMNEGRRIPAIPQIPEGRIEEMESWIDEAMDELEPLRHFILPGGSPGAAALHVARTVCRRAERQVVLLDRDGLLNPLVIVFLNRLSDLLFAWARLENHSAGHADVIWEGLS